MLKNGNFESRFFLSGSSGRSGHPVAMGGFSMRGEEEEDATSRGASMAVYVGGALRFASRLNIISCHIWSIRPIRLSGRIFGSELGREDVFAWAALAAVFAEPGAGAETVSDTVVSLLGSLRDELGREITQCCNGTIKTNSKQRGSCHENAGSVGRYESVSSHWVLVVPRCWCSPSFLILNYQRLYVEVGPRVHSHRDGDVYLWPGATGLDVKRRDDSRTLTGMEICSGVWPSLLGDRESGRLRGGWRRGRARRGGLLRGRP